MANAETLANLRARALDYAGMTGSSFPVTARVTNYINAAASDLYDMLAAAGWYSKTQTITLVAGTETYALPADFYRCQQVYYVTGGRNYPLRRYERKELVGVSPGPSVGGTAKMDYVPHFVRLASESDDMDDAFPTANGAPLPIGWDDYIAMKAASRLLGREESERWMDADIAVLQQRYEQLADPQDYAGRVADVCGRFTSSAYPNAAAADRLVYRIQGGYTHFMSTVGV